MAILNAELEFGAFPGYVFGAGGSPPGTLTPDTFDLTGSAFCSIIASGFESGHITVVFSSDVVTALTGSRLSLDGVELVIGIGPTFVGGQTETHYTGGPLVAGTVYEVDLVKSTLIISTIFPQPPTFTQPDLQQQHLLLPAGLSLSTADIAVPTLSSTHIITLTGINSTNPILSEPTITITSIFIIPTLLAEPTTFTTPTLSHTHLLQPANLSTQPASLLSPNITQHQTLLINSLITTVPILPLPTFATHLPALPLLSLIAASPIFAPVGLNSGLTEQSNIIILLGGGNEIELPGISHIIIRQSAPITISITREVL